MFHFGVLTGAETCYIVDMYCGCMSLCSHILDLSERKANTLCFACPSFLDETVYGAGRESSLSIDL